MKETHILVSIEEFNKIKGNDFNAMTVLLFDSPQVDLSEEGIRQKSIEAYQLFEKGILSESEMYQQCAKDLLNTKQ